MKLYTEEQVRQIIERAELNQHLTYGDVLDGIFPIEIPSDDEIWRWCQTQKFQKEQGEQEYTMLYEIDLPKILKAFIEHFNKIQGGNK